jgi:hypothetical protein
MDALERLFELRQKGVLSEVEFEQEKAKLLGNNSTSVQKPSGSGDPFIR